MGLKQFRATRSKPKRRSAGKSKIRHFRLTARYND